MGIDSAWKSSVLPSKFPEAFLQENPEADFIIDDFSLALRNKLFYGIDTWGDVRGRVYNRLIGVIRPDRLRTYVVLFDESEFVPTAKRPTQRKRRQNPTYKGKPISPFSETEKREFKIDADLTLRKTTPGEYIERMWISGREIMNQVLAFVQKEVIRHYLTHNPPFEIIIDGCRIAKEALLALPGIRIDDLSSNCNLATVLHLSRDHDGVTITVKDSYAIGESDMKIPKHVSLLPDGKVLIFGDSDTIPIILLNSRRWIYESTGFLKHRIYLGSDSVKKKPSKDVIDLTELWRLIQHSFSEDKSITFRIETVVCLMLLTGSDYSEKLLKQFGPVKVWKAFENGGYKLFSKGNAVQSNLEFGLNAIDNKFPVVFYNHKIYDFIFHIYKSKFGTAPTMDAVRRITREEDKKKTSARFKYDVVTDDKLHANIRRIWWNIEYWANGITQFTLPDPVSVHNETGLSTHGWINAMIDGKEDVEVAQKVHTFSKLQE